MNFKNNVRKMIKQSITNFINYNSDYKKQRPINLKDTLIL